MLNEKVGPGGTVQARSIIAASEAGVRPRWIAAITIEPTSFNGVNCSPAATLIVKFVSPPNSDSTESPVRAGL